MLSGKKFITYLHSFLSAQDSPQHECPSITLILSRAMFLTDVVLYTCSLRTWETETWDCHKLQTNPTDTQDSREGILQTYLVVCSPLFSRTFSGHDFFPQTYTRMNAYVFKLFIMNKQNIYMLTLCIHTHTHVAGTYIVFRHNGTFHFFLLFFYWK